MRINIFRCSLFFFLQASLLTDVGKIHAPWGQPRLPQQVKKKEDFQVKTLLADWQRKQKGSESVLPF